MQPAHELHTILILLVAAVVIVALFRKFHVSPVLGYLFAGAIIGPNGIHLIHDTGGIGNIAEFGVVFLLFIIGLELSWDRLRTMRKRIFAAGIAQFVITSIVLAGGLVAWQFEPKTAIIIGCGLALSSTALVLQLIDEHNQKASQLGRLSLAVLLLQDLAIIPVLVLVPALASEQDSIANEIGFVALKAIAALMFIFIIGRILLRPLYRHVASLGNPEIFTALTLLVALGTSWLTYQAGLSLALGAFIAGLLMAETEYRHQVQADIMPYKGLFLGLFFMAVGMKVDIHLMQHQFALIMSLAIGLMAVKAFIILLLFRMLRLGFMLSLQAGIMLSQGGEFAFIVFAMAAEHHFINAELAQLLMTLVTLSMTLTPLAAAIGRWLMRITEHRRTSKDIVATEILDIDDHIVIIGFGRVGQTVAKLISAENMNYVALDLHSSTVAGAKKVGMPVYYGDGSRREVLSAIGIERASAAIVTLHDTLSAERAVRAIRAIAPSLPVIARALDLKRVLTLEKAGATVAVSEMFETSLQLGGALLRCLGIADHEISRITELFRDHDYALARGTLEGDPQEDQSPYMHMLAFQRSVITGLGIKKSETE